MDKIVCSCIRNWRHYIECSHQKLIEYNREPKVGDVMTGYEYLEDYQGNDVVLHQGAQPNRLRWQDFWIAIIKL